jgi:hypothetical protein
MTIATEHAAPEGIMAMLDGELAAAEAHAIAKHMETCAECATVAVQFRETSRAMAAWTVSEAPEKLDALIAEKSARAPARAVVKAPTAVRLRSGKGRAWALGSAGALAGVVLLVILVSDRPMRKSANLAQEERAQSGGYALSMPAPASPPSAGPAPSTPAQAMIADANMATPQPLASQRGTAGMVNGALENPTAPTVTQSDGAPMIARSVSLTIQVKDVAVSRPLLDAILARYRAYAAELTINTPENSARSFSASLRIPAPVLSAALADLRRLGRVESETQSGEEVTQQHADLVARLKNARETEQRLLAILEQRTGKVEEVLQVEEQISNTRGDIERMEAEQKAFEHRVDFAAVQLQLAEEYQAHLNAPANSIGTRMHNSLVTGLGNAGNSLLSILLFFEEYGPVLLVWLVVLGTPAWFLWRRYRNAQSRI